MNPIFIKRILRPNVVLHLIVYNIGDSTLFYRSRCSSISMHFYKGLPITLYYFAEDQKSKSLNNDSSNSGDSRPKKYRQLSLRKITLGPDGPEKGHMFHATITKNTWYARILDRKTIDKGSSSHNKNGMLRYLLHFLIWYYFA